MAETAPAPPAEPTGLPEPTPEPQEPSDSAEGASREAASYRRRLREAEAERDALRARVDGYERREVETVARELGAAVPADMWTLVAIDELRVDGVLDDEIVRTRVGAILAERPTWRRPIPDLGAGARAPAEPDRKPGLSTLLGKR